jgi:hypothetical protein
MKQKRETIRNPIAVAMAKRCKGGEMRSKKDKRSNGKNKQIELLKEAEDE